MLLLQLTEMYTLLQSHRGTLICLKYGFRGLSSEQVDGF